MLHMEEEPDLSQWKLSQDLIGATQLSHQILHPTKKQSNLWRAGTDKLKALLVDGTKSVNQLTKLWEWETSQEAGVRRLLRESRVLPQMVVRGMTRTTVATMMTLEEVHQPGLRDQEMTIVVVVEEEAEEDQEGQAVEDH
jgi:hypothetical protein